MDNYIEGLGFVEVGQIIQFKNDLQKYIVLSVTNDGIVVKKLDVSKIVDAVINDYYEILEALKDDK